jgi:predicted GH43/DUF377 family glycosyl hydrolase
MRTLAAAAALFLAGCRTAPENFTLPHPQPDPHPIEQYQWRAEPLPVLDRGPSGDWDAVDVLNPAIVKRNGRYWNLYSGFDGRTWHTGLAESPDGVTWTKRGKVLSPEGWEGSYIAANGTLLDRSGTLHYWYQAGSPPRIALALSRHGRKWEKLAAPVLEAGPYRSWFEAGVGDPFVVEPVAGGPLFLYFLGQDRAGRQRLGVARSLDGGRSWRHHRANPIFDAGAEGGFDENGVGEPAVWSAGGWWWMLYTGRDREENRRLGLARSRDGISWQRVPGLVIAGLESWNARVLCDPEVEVHTDGSVRVWFGGGSAAHPAERVNGAIGIGQLAPR